MTVSIVIIQVSLSFIAMQVTVSSKNFIFLSLADSLFSKRHYIRFFTTFLNILPKLIYFEGKNYIQIGYKSYLILSFSQ